MKRTILLTIMFISLIGNINAQDSTKVGLTKEKIYSDVKDAIGQIGAALKVGAEHVYEILVKQQIANSIINIVVYITFAILIIIGYNVSKNTYKGHLALCNKEYNTDLDRTPKGILAVILSILTIVLCIGEVVIFVNTISETVTGFINPEYGAIKEIISIIK